MNFGITRISLHVGPPLVGNFGGSRFFDYTAYGVDLILRGRSEPLRAYEPLLADAFKAPAMTQYSQAFAKLEAGRASAMPAFAALVGSRADYPLAGVDLKRLLNGAKGVRTQLE